MKVGVFPVGADALIGGGAAIVELQGRGWAGHRYGLTKGERDRHGLADALVARGGDWLQAWETVGGTLSSVATNAVETSARETAVRRSRCEIVRTFGKRDARHSPSAGVVGDGGRSIGRAAVVPRDGAAGLGNA